MVPGGFLSRVWSLVHQRYKESEDKLEEKDLDNVDKEMIRAHHNTINKVTNDYQNYKFNTAISSLMILMNQADKYKIEGENNTKQTILNRIIKDVVCLLSPIAPHICEELWEALGSKDDSIIHASWPQPRKDVIVKVESLNIVVQVNGKKRANIKVDAAVSEEELRSIVLADENVKKFVEGKDIKKFIYVPGKLANVVV